MRADAVTKPQLKGREIAITELGLPVDTAGYFLADAEAWCGRRDDRAGPPSAETERGS
jgi:hypothetical protein